MNDKIIKTVYVVIPKIEFGVTYDISRSEITENESVHFILSNPINSIFFDDENYVRVYLSNDPNKENILNLTLGDEVILNSSTNELDIKILNERIISGSDYTIQFQILQNN